jgi:hypothetical protein
MKIVDGKQIQHITADGLSYLDEDGHEEYINFIACYEHYLREATSPEYIERIKMLNQQMDWDNEGVKKYVEKRTRWKEIAMRDVLTAPWADGPYIEFYTEPPVRFNFETKEQYSKIRSEIEGFGWKTFDLS